MSLEKVRAFQSRITLHLSSRKTPNIIEVKTKMVEINRMVYELYDRIVILEPVIETVVPTVMF